MVFVFPGMTRISSSRSLTSPMVYRPSTISLDSWFTAATRFRWTPLTGICWTFAKISSLSFPEVIKIPLLNTNAFPDSIP